MIWKIKVAVILMLSLSLGARTQKAQTSNAADRSVLIGAWHLVGINGPDGKPVTASLPKGMLIYTPDGHMSVQLMYESRTMTNEYVDAGYEASFGRFDLDESHHQLTHHVQGANTRDRLVGKDLPRSYQLLEGRRLLIRSTRPDEHWSVTWERY